MKPLKNFIIESNDITKLDDETYVIYEFSLNDIQSDNYLSKCLHTTYKDRLLIVRGWGGIRFYMHILNIRELKNCFAEYFKVWHKADNSVWCWTAPEEVKTEEDVKEFIKKNSDEIEMDDICKKDRKVKIVVKR